MLRTACGLRRFREERVKRCGTPRRTVFKVQGSQQVNAEAQSRADQRSTWQQGELGKQRAWQGVPQTLRKAHACPLPQSDWWPRFLDISPWFGYSQIRRWKSHASHQEWFPERHPCSPPPLLNAPKAFTLPWHP